MDGVIKMEATCKGLKDQVGAMEERLQAVSEAEAANDTLVAVSLEMSLLSRAARSGNEAPSVVRYREWARECQLAAAQMREQGLETPPPRPPSSSG